MHLYNWRGCNKKGQVFTGKYWAENQLVVAEFVRGKHGYVIDAPTCRTLVTLVVR